MIDIEEFDVLFGKYYGELFVFARQMLSSDADCEDIVSDVFEDVWHNQSRLEKPYLRAYLYKSVRNKCIDFLRRQQTRQHYAELMAAASRVYDRADATMEQHERERIVCEVLNSLPDYTRQIFVACYVEHHSYQEVAERMNISVNTVKKYISRALSLIAEQRKKYKNI